MEALIIRHGMITPPKDAEGNDLMYPTDTPLNQEGHAQAERLAASLRHRGLIPARIYSSPYARALQYATEVATRIGVTEIIPHYELRDPDIPGWIGVPTKEIDNENTDIYASPRSVDQETYEHLIQRMERIFYELGKANTDELFGLVSHGDPIQVLMRRIQFPAEPIDEIPRMNILRKENYLQRGDAWYLRFNRQNLLDSREHIGQDYQFMGS
jgi:broad specificity phosphatase PhoE